MKELLIASPANPSTFHSDNVKIVGVLRGIKSPNGAFSLVLDQQAPKKVDPQITKHGSDLILEINQQFSELVPNNLSERRNHSLQLHYKDDVLELLSPISTITFRERASWDEPLGGYIYPDANSLEVHSRYLVVEGWAAKRGAIQKEVSLYLDGQKFPCPNINVWSPLVGQNLPSLEHAQRAHFNIVLERPRFYLPFFRRRRVFIEVIFSDGSKFRLPKIEFAWSKPIKLQAIVRKQSSGILFIGNNLRATEGAPKVLFEIIRVASSLGQKVGVITPLGGELENSIKDLGVEVQIIPDLHLAHYSRFENFRQQTAKANQFINEFNPTLVFGNTIEAFWGISFAQSLGISTLWLLHESIDPKVVFEELDPRARVLFLEALDRAECIFVSKATQSLFDPQRRKTSVIPNGVRPLNITAAAKKELRLKTRANLNVPEGCPLVLNVGTICQRKGQDFLLNVVSRIKDLEFRLILVGARESDFLETIKAQVTSQGLSSKVIIQEETSDVEKFYAAADLFAISSREESAPLVSLEALNWSLPIISTDAFGLVEQLKDSSAALLSPVDNVELFASHLRLMITDKDLRDKSASNAKSWVERKFNLEANLEIYKNCLRNICR